MQIMNRRIFKKDDAGRNLDTAHDDIHGGAATRPVGLPIRQLAGDILIAAQRVEVVLVVVVQGGFVAQPLPDRIGVVVDVEIERVVVNRSAGHDPVFLSDRASGNTASPTRLRYGHATSGGRPPHNGARLSICPARTREIASGTEIITCDAAASRSSATVDTCEKPAEVSLPGFHSAYIRASWSRCTPSSAQAWSTSSATKTTEGVWRLGRNTGPGWCPCRRQ